MKFRVTETSGIPNKYSYNKELHVNWLPANTSVFSTQPHTKHITHGIKENQRSTHSR